MQGFGVLSVVVGVALSCCILQSRQTTLLCMAPVEKCRAEPWGNYAVLEKVHEELCPRVSRSNRAAVGLGDFVYSVVD